ncbi:MAG: hypothetical protein R3247_03760 [Rhodothermales bacterium]|nr:hypothetical protein [Rhodothermales bacterium]
MTHRTVLPLALLLLAGLAACRTETGSAPQEPAASLAPLPAAVTAALDSLTAQVQPGRFAAQFEGEGGPARLAGDATVRATPDEEAVMSRFLLTDGEHRIELVFEWPHASDPDGELTPPPGTYPQQSRALPLVRARLYAGGQTMASGDGRLEIVDDGGGVVGRFYFEMQPATASSAPAAPLLGVVRLDAGAFAPADPPAAP